MGQECMNLETGKEGCGKDKAPPSITLNFSHGQNQ